MTDDVLENCRFFVSYTGVKLPVRLVNPLEEKDLKNRNTFIRAQFDEQERLVYFEKVVYAHVEMWHRYAYHANGAVKQAEISMDDDLTVLSFDENGAPVVE